MTCALKAVFSSPAGKDCVFKGGTSLSKCFGLIERFSEDIDLVVKQSGDESGAQLKKKLKTVSRAVDKLLPEVPVDGLTMKFGMNRKTVHKYPKLFDGRFGQVRDFIVLESSWLGEHEPCTVYSLSCYLYDMMLRNGQRELAESFDLLPFEVQVLSPKRTMCEKIMSLVRFSNGADPVEDLKKKVRHVYDLYQLLNNAEYCAFFESDEFELLLKRVAESDLKTLKKNTEWISRHPAEAIVFADAEKVWDELEPHYSGEFRDLVYGELPPPADMPVTLTRIRDRMRSFEWV